MKGGHNMESRKNIDRYFAAANGYSGFRSYFSTLFDSKDFTRILVLKGGPGTGKSSFMKKIITEIKDETINKTFYLEGDKLIIKDFIGLRGCINYSIYLPIKNIVFKI